MGFIYKISNDINNKVYIGKTNFTIEDRWKEHLHDSQRNNDKRRPLYNAMNKYGSNHFFISCIEEVDDNLLSEREIYWIQQYDSYNNGYNATLGGDGRISLDYDLVISLYEKYQNVREVARQIGADRTAIEDILHAKEIKVLSAGEVAKNLNSLKVAQIDKNTNKIIRIFSSLSEAEFAVPTGRHISDVCKGKRLTAGGYKWKYME